MAGHLDRAATRSRLFSYWQGQGYGRDWETVRTALAALERFSPTLHAALEDAHVRKTMQPGLLEEAAVDAIGELLGALTIRPGRRAA